MRIEILLDRLNEAARRHRFTSKIYAKIGDYELPVYQRIASENAPSVYISSGIHGDEPAGPMAILDLLRNKRFPDDLNLFILPILNPTGLAQQKRENINGIDLNRDYGPQPQTEEISAHQTWLANQRFDLTICLHEDYESQGAYLYELKTDKATSVSQQVLDAMEPFVGIETSNEIDGMPAENGLMRPPLDRLESFREKANAPEAVYLYFNYSPRSITLETPSKANIVQRIGAQTAALLKLLELASQGTFKD